MRRRFLTPNVDALSGVDVRRFFCIDSSLAQYLTGAIDELTNVDNWEAFGDMTPGEVVEIFEEVVGTMGNCDNIGVIFATLGNVPNGCLLLDGQSVLVDDYPLLASAVPGLVAGSVINLPDMTDSYLVGSGVAGVGLFTGENSHTLTVDEIPPHTHDYVSAAGSVTTVVVPDEPSAVPAPAVTSPAGGGLPHNNMPRSIGVNWVVVAK